MLILFYSDPLGDLKSVQVKNLDIGLGFHANFFEFKRWACKDTNGRIWKFQKDVSIAGPDDEKCEMVTPILKYEDIDALQEIIRILRKVGAKSDATRMCGVHIHIGANGHTPKTMRNLTKLYVF